MSNISDNTVKLLTLSALQGVGTKTLSNLEKLKDLSSFSVEELVGILALKEISQKDIVLAKEFANKNIEISQNKNHSIISIFDDSYPGILKATEDRPVILYCAGDVKILNQKSLAVIGTREPTEHGKIIASNITKWFSNKGWNIISGLAKGIDSIAHRTAIENHGKTVAVMAQGLEKIYPAENKKLALDIIDNGGLLISEYSYGSHTFRNNFVQRDRIQAGLSAAVLMVQSDLKGGSLHASRSAINYGRYLIIPNQSNRDIINNEPKIQANLTFMNGDSYAIRNLLKVNNFMNDRLLIMKNSNDYTFIEGMLVNSLQRYQISSNGFDF
ncbi:TPA: DNA-protecting protein DprA [Enterobacter hormaechei]|uniref:DNA-processing protein DprA n=1 Tax=Enterobacter hormaechei TaxID=158836 RepID=UPI001663D956|nr:DNA-processing protein DprA [Enterobacter hormaechei]MBF4155327.1 DNA-protecting protein DprA [Enterobacter hormaechei]HCR0890734.1 DNA-protecting protein DprA [Enterobacter hormaechei]